MKRNGWRYGIAVGLAGAVVIGSFGINALAAGKKTVKSGADIVAEAGEVESIKIIKNVYQAEGKEGVLDKAKTDQEAAEPRSGEESEANETDHITEDSGDGKTREADEAENSAEGDAASGGEEAESGEDAEGDDEGEAVEENAEEIDAYFDDSVFVGDSIMLGFRNYAMKRQETFLSRLNFLAAGSYSANNALWDVDEKSVHPVYQGEQRQVWESISLMGSKKVFLMLGMNDLNITGVEGSCEKYEELIGKIKEKNPDAEIIIMSMTYVLKGKETGKLQNDTIREYNEMLKEMAEKNGWGYVDVAEALADENGDLAAEYCSDEFAHQNPEAYDVWVSVLRKYADEHLE